MKSNCNNCGYKLEDYAIICEHGEFCSRKCLKEFHSELERLEKLEKKRNA